jgi:hypothetical protein
MGAGRIIEDEFGSFEDEVLNAGWLPPREDVCPVNLGEHHSSATPVDDPDAFIHRIYLSQE